MDVREVLKWVDELVLAKTGKHLNSLQQDVLAGIWDNQIYREIADRYHCSEANVKKVAGPLFKLVSQELGEEVNKLNFRAAMERYHISRFSNYSNYGNFVQNVGRNINVCGKNWPSAETAENISSSTATNPDSIKREKIYDLTEAPECDRLYDRTTELTTLKQWILAENIRIVTIIGLSGIGKTALARQLVEEIKDKFDRVIWRNCTNRIALDSLEANLMQLFSQDREPALPSIIDYMRSRPSLIVLDDFQELFLSGELAGTYLPNHENYSTFCKQIATLPHNSCLLVLSWEKPTRIVTLESRNLPCRTLQLNGLGESAREICSARGLTDEDKWLELIQLYGGNPLWLSIIANTILELFNGSVAQFLSYPSLFLGDLEPILSAHYRRLSESEKLVMQWLATQEAAVDIARKPTDLPFSDSDFLKAVQSLNKRCLIAKVTDNKASRFTLQSAIEEYVKNQSHSYQV
ncbi:MAG: AAA family ATPase [Hormoscilla sp. GM7CHS1pb]|nr:AAA family ATPase [Hormoscilla sp. GM7CHS1pb]